MNENVSVIFGLAGGLALFLYGMNSMSDALQKAAGERMKKILEFLTKNPIMGALAGALVTAVLQSSSATTVMVIGFVSAGLMKLPQAISVIFGANIGTTMTAQLIAFKISDYIYPIIFIGFMIYFISKKEKIKNIGMVIFSFGLLFEGIEIMGSVMKPLANSPIFIDMMGKVSEIPVLGVLLGLVMTLVVQSSSATIAVLQNFAAQAGPDGVTSVIGLAGAIPILLGDNIGTTITALLASIGQSKNAKRTAVAHSVFNITGSMVFIWIIPVLVKFVEFISPKGNEVDIISRQIANAHTTFNVVCTLIWLPLIPLMVKIVTWLVRGNDEKATVFWKPKYLDDKVISQPAAAIYLVANEVDHLSELAASMLGTMKDAITEKQDRLWQEKLDESFHAVKKLSDLLNNYITRLFSSGNLTEEQSEQAAVHLYVSNNIDRIADRCGEVSEICKQMNEEGKQMSEKALSDLRECIRISQSLFEGSMEAVREGNQDYAQEVIGVKDKLRKAQKKLKKDHLKRIKAKECDVSMTKEFSQILYNLDRIADGCIGIAEEAVS
ncbi:Na/Pi cotransporter family protein [Dorea phocaeensis]|uniref:Na/Pi cotransporter family protein n=1 Tax=Dorea phocaeensis TaxID=2040291 RepID=A0A850HGR6_9FIRM|nr:Na/Pi cotransporter family protein [Dorea phocaeensis]NSK13275.1 Na/Pi cotransporter family protein [Dorea phocaeensis]NVH57596.1 Na/Pi cotransporter family protein [Dorea phocaeensis]